MSDGKLNMPADTELLKTQRAAIEADAKVEVGRLQVAKEAISAVRSICEVFKSYNELESTRVEWEGRVIAAETGLRKAQVDLEKAREKNMLRKEELRQTDEALSRVLELFDEVLVETRNPELSEESKREARKYLLELSAHIVKLKK